MIDQLKNVFVIFICCVLYFSIQNNIHAQDYSFRHYSVESGLSNAIVNDILQDHKNYIWIATEHGLNQFNGYDFTLYDIQHGLRDVIILSLYEDSKNRLWIGTQQGIQWMIDGEIINNALFDVLKNTPINIVYEDQEGNYWIGTDGKGIWQWNHLGDFIQLSTEQKLHNLRVRDIIEHDNAMWFATRSGLIQLKNGKFKYYNVTDGLPTNRLRDLFIDSKKQLWIGTRNGLVKYENNEFKLITDPTKDYQAKIWQITENHDGLWMSTEHGASIYKDGVFTYFTSKNGLSSTINQTIYNDLDNNIWIGGYNGISYFNGMAWLNYTTENILPINSVRDITQDTSKVTWIATYGGGVVKLENQKDITIFNTTRGLSDDKVYSVEWIKDRLYVGTREGLSYIKNDKVYNIPPEKFPYRKVSTITYLESDNSLLIGTIEDGFIKWKDSVMIHYNTANGLSGNNVKDIFIDDNDIIWISSFGGLDIIFYDKIIPMTYMMNLPSYAIIETKIEKDGSMWICTLDGLVHINRYDTEWYDNKHKFPGTSCHFIVKENHSNYYWIGTNIGIVRLDYELYKNLDINKREASYHLITTEQGLTSIDINDKAIWYDKEEKVYWIGTKNGMSRFDPSQFNFSDYQPKFGDLSTVNDESIMGTKITLTALNYRAPYQIVYEYKIPKLKTPWREITQFPFHYDFMPYGSNIVEYRIRNRYGKSQIDSISISKYVPYPIWLRWWFSIIIIMTIIAIIIYIYYYNKTKKQRDIERMRVRIASDLHDDVGTSLTEIALQSDSLISSSGSHSEKKSLQQIGLLTRRIVSSLDDIVWSIDSRNDTIDDLIVRIKEHANAILRPLKINILYDIISANLSKKMAVGIKENIYLICKEAINNIAKHSNANEVLIKFMYDKYGKYELSIRDNGTISKNARITGQGIKNMKMRCQRINAYLHYNSSDGFSIFISNKNKNLL